MVLETYTHKKLYAKLELGKLELDKLELDKLPPEWNNTHTHT